MKLPSGLSAKQLRKLYGLPSERAAKKVLPQLDQHCRSLIALSPFFLLGTRDDAGRMDVSPRGGKPGFVFIEDSNTLLIPDAKGNNRIDSLINIAITGSVGLLFLVPGIDETLRVNGKAVVLSADLFTDQFKNEEKTPLSVIAVTVEEAFLHCAKAFMRSQLWDIESQVERNALPSMGQMLKDQLKDPDPPESQEDMERRYKKDM